MRILVGAAVPRNPDSGAAGDIYHTIKALRELGHDVDEIWEPDLGRKIRHGNLHYLLELPRSYRDVVRERTKNKQYDVVQLSQPHAYLAAKDHLQSNRPGIFINYSHGWELKVQDAELFWRRKLRMPENKFPRSIGTVILRRLLRSNCFKVVRYSDGVVLQCRDDSEYLINRMNVDASKIAVVRNAVSSLFLDEPVLPLDMQCQRNLLYVGQFAFFKGPHFLSRVFNTICESDDTSRLTWVCAREDHRSAWNLLSEHAKKRTKFVEWQNQENLCNIYDKHGIFIFPSIAEGGGKAAMEAMSRGLCVVASDTSGMRDAISNKKNSFLIPVGDTRKFAKSVLSLLNDFDHCLSVSENARKTALDFTWENTARQLTNFYETLLLRRQTLLA